MSAPAKKAADAPAPAGPPRRNLLAAMAAGGFGLVAGIMAIVPGGWAFISPLLKKRDTAVRWIRVAMLDAVPADGLPHRFPIIEERVDAWNRYPPEPVGAVYLTRTGATPSPQCFTADCPHLGCSVDFKSDQNEYKCPCHASGFALDGHVLFGPSPRPLDSLSVELRNGNEIWVRFEKFRSGIAEKIAQ
ncbi:MAG: Rieske 2Fe-2S domain-containing protein [Planctomycetia bacterium]|nr:Rieske 2Fe-2S domain-containing protein [Planctomycetia bacterium]